MMTTGLNQTNYFEKTLQMIQDITPPVLSSSVGRQIPTNQLLTAFGGDDMVVLICGGGKYLSQVYTCWQMDENHLPTTRIPCPKAVLGEHTCTQSSVIVVGFQ